MISHRDLQRKSVTGVSVLHVLCFIMSQLKQQIVKENLPVPWGHIAAKIYGPPKEKKILVVHGTLDNSGSFDRLIELLPYEYQYVSIDLPGHGFSSHFPPGLPLQYFDYVYTIFLVLNTLKWKTCIYLSHSFGTQIGVDFSVLYPGRLQKIISLDGLVPLPIEDTINHIKRIYSLDVYDKVKDTLYTKEEVIYALQYKRREALNSEAAEAMFTRAVTKVGDKYKYNRDPRLRIMVRPVFTKQQRIHFWQKFSTPIFVIVANKSNQYVKLMTIMEDIKNIVANNCNSKFIVVPVIGNHDVHNNYPERVAPYVCEFLKDDTRSKL
ncbi:serine hydrolase-like protein isoform X1 [Nomia melanderi]|uniref:serine hydrolase-like protein isoform X1 n=2 Tax=Nomia melanderi TaxID=2448451 RepID=UPI003FCC4F78